ncbi:hypothetical protein HF086_014310 [Spodoptera exigua]|nr:hypothetical protein HF086_014310 [Spodoptera exigua]
MPKSQRNQAVPTKTSLLLTLRYLATGSYLRSAADFCGVSPPTASRIVKKVTEAIAQLRTVIIKFPDNLSTLQDGFYEIASFPRVIGALDCTHVAIKSPENLYNESHIRTRNTIERCFGVCKNRFPVLRRQITLNLARVQAIIVACFVLHNIAIDVNERNFGDNYNSTDTQTLEEIAAQSPELNYDPRNRLVQEYFLPLLNNNRP